MLLMSNRLYLSKYEPTYQLIPRRFGQYIHLAAKMKCGNGTKCRSTVRFHLIMLANATVVSLFENKIIHLVDVFPKHEKV